tara:strand:- start:6821 stop:8287 length:1467 start_codon:yes stop_codon:yes gene_type:complete
MILRTYFLPIIFGFVGIFSFAPFSIKPLLFGSLAYLIHIAIYEKNSKLLKIFLWGIGHWGFGMSWIIVSIYYYGKADILTSLILYLLLVSTLTLVFTLPLYFLSKYLDLHIGNNKIILTTVVSSILLILEYTRGISLNGVPWLIPGNIFVDTYTQNIFSYLGVSFGSFLIYIIATLIAINWKKINVNLIYVIFALLFFTIPENKKIETNNYDLSFSIIQSSLDPFNKYENDYYLTIEQRLLDLYENRVSKNIDLIIFPEAELPYSLQDNRFNSFLDKINNNEEVLIGVWSYENNNLFNSIYSKKSMESYKKQSLVPFGEYIPFSSFLRGLIDFFDLPMSNVSKGPKNQENIKILNNIEVSTPICFDIAFTNKIRKMNKSSLFMVNISNDTWFGNSIGPYQHLTIARIRAIENNRWTIRATNNGITAIIDNKGTIVDYIAKNQIDVLEGDLKFIYEPSFYNKYGYFLIFLLPFITLVLFSIRFYAKKNI